MLPQVITVHQVICIGKLLLGDLRLSCIGKQYVASYIKQYVTSGDLYRKTVCYIYSMLHQVYRKTVCYT